MEKVGIYLVTVLIQAVKQSTCATFPSKGVKSELKFFSEDGTNIFTGNIVFCLTKRKKQENRKSVNQYGVHV